MAETSIRSDIFKFVSLRPAVPVTPEEEATHFIADSRVPEETPVGELTRSFSRDDGTNIPKQTKDFIREHNYELSYARDSVLAKVQEFVLSLDASSFSFNKLITAIEEMLGSKIATWLQADQTKSTLNNLWDRYYAFFILSRTEPVSLDPLTNNLRTFHLLARTLDLETLDYSTLQDILAAKPLVPGLFTHLPRPSTRGSEDEPQERDASRVDEYEQLWSQLIDTHRAIDEIRNLRFEMRTETNVTDVVIPNLSTGRQGTSKLLTVTNRLVARPRSIETLHANTKRLIGLGDLRSGELQPIESLAQLQSKLEGLYRVASSISDPMFTMMMPLTAKNYAGLTAIEAKPSLVVPSIFPSTVPVQPPTNIRASIKPLGIGDLKVVKQTLKKYVAGEVAHIENVLRGEYKDRKHRTLDRSEDILTIATETEELTSKDTQSTDRFELKKESEKTLQENMSVQAGVTVSASYGAVTFGAHGDFAYSTASTESNRSASNFAREVIDKSVSRIQKRLKEERTTKKLHEVEEINTHGIDNKEKLDHAIGVYRWVDKYFEAQIYNYGKRMMFEFIIPEPAAFWEYAQAHKPKHNFVPPKSIPADLTHKSITVDNYQNFIRDYNVQGVLPPPPPYKTISTAIVKEGMPLDGNAHGVNSKELVVPAGYISKVGLWWDCSVVWSHYPIVEITIGNKIFRPLEVPRTDGDFDTRFSMGNNHDRADIPYHWFWPESPIQLSVNTYDVLSYTLNVYALCERTLEAYELWQIQTFEKILSAYKAAQIEYEQKVSSQETIQGITITGQNPRINREIEKTELKKHCTKMLMDTYLYGSFDAMKDMGTDAPEFDIFDAMGEGKVIQFFEQAFEWDNMTYLFYPYFWSRRTQWIHKTSASDPDPLFRQFRQAGSARAVLPVHPGYNDAIMFFLENNGAIWSGGDTPRLNDPLFKSLAEELRNRTDDLVGAVAEGEPWEVIVPTTLVYLQQNAALPVFP